MYNKPISYSGKSLYKECPLRWHDVYVLGNRQPSGPAADRGTYLHELLESFFKGESVFPGSNRALAPWQKYMETLAMGNPVAEGEVAVRRDWSSCAFDDPDAYFRGKKDLELVDGRTLNLYDWKSGKEYDSHVYQGQSYSALTPGYDFYKVHFVYLDIPFLVKSWEYTGIQVEEFKVQITDEIEVIRNATEFIPTPGDHCRWCHLSWRRGGTCKRAP